MATRTAVIRLFHCNTSVSPLGSLFDLWLKPFAKPHDTHVPSNTAASMARDSNTATDALSSYMPTSQVSANPARLLFSTLEAPEVHRIARI